MDVGPECATGSNLVTSGDQTEAHKQRTERAHSAAKEPCWGLTNHIGLGPTLQLHRAYFRGESEVSAIAASWPDREAS